MRTVRRVDIGAGVVLAVFGVFVVVQSLRLSLYADGVPGPGFFPSVLGVALVVTGGGLAVSRWVKPRLGDDELKLPNRRQAVHSLALWGVVFCASLALGVLGFAVTMVLLVAVTLFVIEGRRRFGSVVATIAIPALAWLLFGWLLQVPLPTSPFGF